MPPIVAVDESTAVIVIADPPNGNEIIVLEPPDVGPEAERLESVVAVGGSTNIAAIGEAVALEAEGWPGCCCCALLESSLNT